MSLSPELVVAIVSVCGVIIAAILKLAPKRNVVAGNSEKKLDIVHKRIDERQLIAMCDEKHKNLEDTIGRIEATGLQTNTTVTEIFRKMKM